MTQPIKPNEVAIKKLEVLPDGVIEAFNELIALNWDGTSSKFKLKEAALKVAVQLNIELFEVYDNSYMDVEDIYRDQGWKVYFDRPGYNETYDATYTFSKE